MNYYRFTHDDLHELLGEHIAWQEIDAIYEIVKHVDTGSLIIGNIRVEFRWYNAEGFPTTKSYQGKKHTRYCITMCGIGNDSYVAMPDLTFRLF